MKNGEVREILHKKYKAYRDQVVVNTKALPADCRTSGDDSGLEDVWEEFKSQVQWQESLAFEAYVETIQAVCRTILKSLPDHELEFLWLRCDMYFDQDDDAGLPVRAELIDGVVEELYKLVLELAADEDLKADPEEVYDADDFDDDEIDLIGASNFGAAAPLQATQGVEAAPLPAMMALPLPLGQEKVPFVNRIIQHWRENFPKQARELETQQLLLPNAQRAAEKTAAVMEQCLAKGMGWSQAYELAVQEWGTP